MLSPSLYRWAREGGEFVAEVLRRFRRDHCTLMAAALAYYTLLTLLPLLLLSVAGFGYFLGSSEQALERTVAYLNSVVPVPTDEIVRTLVRVYANRQLTGTLGLLSLLWICSQIFITLQKALDLAWGKETHRPLPLLYGMAFLTILLLGLFVFLSLALTSFLTSLQHFNLSLFGLRAENFSWAWQLAGYGVAAFLSVMLFFLVYRLLPSAPVHTLSALYGSLFAGLAWEAAKHGFGWFVVNFGQFDRVYGPLAGLIILILWSFYSSLILLLGAEIAAVHGQRQPQREQEADSPSLGK
ncbi:MAG TPA: YihY/virulence factor BrkB family protein [Armatimonadetes bacterium]|nr:YihY/virulence factor BrkB family protein [Armatimonadota bacterium]